MPDRIKPERAAPAMITTASSAIQPLGRAPRIRSIPVTSSHRFCSQAGGNTTAGPAWILCGSSEGRYREVREGERGGLSDEGSAMRGGRPPPPAPPPLRGRGEPKRERGAQVVSLLARVRCKEDLNQ